jgi:hypothetical protein
MSKQQVLPSRYPPTHAVIALCGLALVLDILLGPFVMLKLGIHYEAEGGNPIIKIHPGSYIVLAAVALHFLSLDHPMRIIGSLSRRWPGLVVHVCGMAVVFTYALFVRGRSGVAFLLDTFLVPGVLALIVADASGRAKQHLVTGMILALALNAVLALVEVALHKHFFPYIIDGQYIIDGAFRATAFAGHPLRNAMLTAIAMLATAGRPWPLVIRTGFVSLFALALLAFGGRTGLTIGCAGTLLFAVRAMRRTAREDAHAFVRHAMEGIIVALAAAGVLTGVLTLTDLGERFRDIGTSAGGDSSSAARLLVFDVFAMTNPIDLLGGYSAASIDAMAKLAGLLAIENFWLYLLLFLGAIGFAIWLCALFAGLASLWNHAGWIGRVLLVCGMIVASGNNSLAKKDSALAILYVFVLGAGVGEERRVRVRLARPEPATGVAHAR